MGVEGEGKGHAAGSRNECFEEGCRRVTRLKHIRNEEVRQRLQQMSIVEVVREKRESWRVKVMEKQGSLVERVMAGEVEGRRTRGRPRKRWGDPF